MNGYSSRVTTSVRCAIVGALIALCPSVGQANTVNITYLEGKAPVAPDAITTLGPDLLGDRVNLFNGALEFEHTDLSLPGNSQLSVALTRRHVAARSTYVAGQFGDWDLEVPRISGTFSLQRGWVAANGTTNRCSQFSLPPIIPSGGVSFLASDYWQGNFLYAPGEGAQEVLRRAAPYTSAPADGRAYPLVTRNNWQIGCLPSLQNAAGEGFFAVSPSGVRYRFDWMTSRPHEDVKKSGQSIGRAEWSLMATEVIDRFGNWVRYTYDSGNPYILARIEASDGRVITLTNSADRVSSATDGTRVFNYGYTPQGRLSFVEQPDGSRWSFDLGPLVSEYLDSIGEDANCDQPGDFPGEPALVGTITHPSGVVGRFSTMYVVHGRTFVTRACRFVPNSRLYTTGAVWPRYFITQALVGKSITGPGIAPLVWSYSYSSIGGWTTCTTCSDRRRVSVTDPRGVVTLHSFGTRWRVNEGQLLQVDEGWNGSSALRTTTYRYRTSEGQAYPDQFGSNLLVNHDWLSARNRPQDQRVITQQDVSFVWEADASAAGFDLYARPLRSRSWSSLGPSRTLDREYEDFPSLWVLGQTRRVAEAVTGAEMERTDFHAASGLPSAKYSFGRPTQSRQYYPNGLLHKLVDPAGKTITFEDFHRGQPRRAVFADGKFATQVINNLGNASSHTNEVNTTTSFEFDAMGRVARIIYPTGDDEPYCDTIQSFQQVWVSDRGLDPGHWRQTINTCNAKTERWFDGFWRVRLQRKQDTANPTGTGSTVETRFDGGGSKAFESYPQRDIALVDVIEQGTNYRYDALNRMVEAKASSEMGPLVTTTDYLGGFTKRVQNPRGHATTFAYQVFDEPSEDAISSISLPEAVQVSLVRDVFGKASSITRTGPSASGPVSATRSYTYDANQRLCKTVEPETGATVQGYDLSGNLAWRVSGQPGNASCDFSQQPGGSKISFDHDLRNRLEATRFGDGQPGITRTYWDDGLPKTVASSSFNWAYVHNNRRLLKSEAFSVPGQTPGTGWHFTRFINRYGHPASLTDYWGTMGYAPNALGAPTEVSGYASQVSYHPSGMVAGYRLNNGIWRSITPNERGLPEFWQDTNVINDTYSYDANGNVMGIVDHMAGGRSRSMAPHDGLDRLTAASGAWGSALYTYDGLDNMRSSQVGARTLTHHFGDSSNRLTALSGSQNFNVNYDVNGNVVQRGGQAYGFDIANRMRSAPGVVNYYDYDGHGRRSWVVWADGKTQLNAYGFGNASGSTGRLLFSAHSTKGATRYVYLGDKLIAEHNNQTGLRFSHTDALGSPVAWSSDAGVVSAITRYEPYGATAEGPNPDSIGFTGHVNDPETGLVYMQQRYYDPIAGRFLSVDPVTTDAKTGDHFNRYVYAENNPYTFKDPDGRAPIAVPMLLGAISGAIGAMRDPDAGIGKIALGAIGGAAAGAVGTLAIVGKTLGVSIGQAALAGGMGNVVGQVIGDPSKPPNAAQAATQAAISAVGGVAGHGAAAAVRGASTAAETASVASTVSTAVSTVGNAAVPQSLGGMGANKPAAAPATPQKPDEKLSK